ncbi:1-acyl-sn-glycerol-3-phosphate acyltransferase alpha-like [Saccoglossus kowalevskii]|uniref:1-acyl-sn-glycerol-3-phosphate acyltransferase n=1 Tax=Saccoglossus kowalevskii TaxID=10224 RepID=A0ABM0H1D3_SACKO|nr:PREDICTED: 1-acyl-sn-glycerol-3-phosphate acyltransferase alpha-like [Saccoglossus kowalevskii]
MIAEVSRCISLVKVGPLTPLSIGLHPLTSYVIGNMVLQSNLLQSVGVLAGVVFTLYVLCQWSRFVHYHVKHIAAFIWSGFLAAFVIPCALLRPMDPTNTRWYTFWERLFFTMPLFQAKIIPKNLHYFDTEEPQVLVANHQSIIDNLGAMEIWPQRCVMVAKKSVLFAGTFGFASWLCGTIFVDRFNAAKAKETTRKIANVMKRKRTSVWMFAEGTRNYDKSVDMLPFKKGAFYAAIEAQAPIVPVVFSNYRDHVNAIEHRFDPVEITITILPPISTKGRTVNDVQALSDEVRECMLEAYRKSPSKTMKTDLKKE